MKASDIITLAVSNTTRNKFRTIVTIIGIAIGISSLSSMISIGQSISDNISNTLVSNDIFTGMTVSPREADYANYGTLGNAIYNEKNIPLNDSTIAKIEQLKQVSVVFPEITKYAEIELFGHKTKSSIKSIPSIMGTFKPFNNLTYGNFYTSDYEPSIVLSKSALMHLGIILTNDTNFGEKADSEIISPDSIIGSKINIITKVFDPNKMNTNTLELPVKNDTTTLTIIGITENNPLSDGMIAGGFILPPKTCDLIPSVDIKHVYALINGQNPDLDQYQSVYVKVNNFKELKTVKNAIEDMGYIVFSVGDKLEDIEKIFLLIDTLLAAIGIIAILISVFGIINTLTMAIYERRKEIGILKALGIRRIQIKLIFYIEAAITGIVGGIVGVVVGYWIAKTVSTITLNQINKIIDTNGYILSFSWHLIGIAILIALLSTIIAAIYPAQKAAKVDPLNALRRE